MEVALELLIPGCTHAPLNAVAQHPPPSPHRLSNFSTLSPASRQNNMVLITTTTCRFQSPPIL